VGCEEVESLIVLVAIWSIVLLRCVALCCIVLHFVGEAGAEKEKEKER